MDGRATGRDIILAIVDNMRESQEPLLYTTLVASHYDVYLHREDYDRLVAILPKIREEVCRALKDELAQMQRKKRSLVPGFKKEAIKAQAAENDWYVKFHVDEDEELGPGDILVDSRLTLPPEKEYGTGSKTQRMVTVRSGGETKRLNRDRAEPVSPTAAPVAKLIYMDKEGNRQEYLMTAPEIAVGRGGQAEFCDLQLDGPPDISRKHLYLRRDEASHDFFIQDVSRFGTTVDGSRIAPQQWIKIPSRARIKLADKVVLEFESL